MYYNRSGHHRSLCHKLFNQELVSTTEAQHISVSDIHTSDDGNTLLEETLALVSGQSNEDLEQESEEMDEDDPAETSLTRKKATVATRMKIKNWLNPNENILLGGVSRIVKIT